MPVSIVPLLESMIQLGASDLHLKVGRPPLFRLNSQLEEQEAFLEPLLPDDTQRLAEEMMHEKARRELRVHHSADFSFGLQEGSRFRVNAFRQRGVTGLVIRRIPSKVPTVEEMGLPAVLKKLTQHHQGLILVTGPTGSGKSTTLASMIHHINATRKVHVMTLEDPIEFYHADQLACINQREIGADAPSFQDALRSVLRQDPDIILLGEMRDQDTIKTALTAAETGHLVLSTLHTNSAAASIDRIANTFPKSNRPTILAQLSSVLVGVVSQQLVRTVDGKRTAALEVMINTPIISKFIRSGETQEILPQIEKGVIGEKMQSMNQSLCALWANGRIDEDTAMGVSISPDDLKQLYDRSFFLERFLEKDDSATSVLDADSMRRLEFLRSLPKFPDRIAELTYLREKRDMFESQGRQSADDLEGQLRKLEEERNWVIKQMNDLKRRMEMLKEQVDKEEHRFVSNIDKFDGEIKILERKLARLKAQATDPNSSSGGTNPPRGKGLFG